MTFETAILAFLWILLKIVMVLVPVLVAVLAYTYFERKVLAYMHVRVGPNRVGPMGFFQPLADAVKLIFKEIIFPKSANLFLFILAPILSVAPALAVWSVIPFFHGGVVANVNAGVLFILAMTSFGAYGVLMAGWASNSKYALFGALRAAAQIISYEIGSGN